VQNLSKEDKQVYFMLLSKYSYLML
jgi:hypothetical protein